MGKKSVRKPGYATYVTLACYCLWKKKTSKKQNKQTLGFLMLNINWNNTGRIRKVFNHLFEV